MKSPDPLGAAGSIGNGFVNLYNGVKGRESDQVLRTAQASTALANAAVNHSENVEGSSRSQEDHDQAQSNANNCLQKANADVKQARYLRDSSEVSLPTVSEESVDLIAGSDAIAP